jgi:hypothetical protein
MNWLVNRLARLLPWLALVVLFTVNSCTNEHLVSIAVTPQNASVTQTGDTTQFQAIGTTNHTAVPPENLTSGVTWSSSTTGVATITSTGLATTVGCGTTTITAQDGSVVGQTTFTNTCAGSGQVLQSITVLPSNPTIPERGQTTQFLALGTLAGGAQEDLTSSATWSSSNIQIATVGSTGTPTPGAATALDCGQSLISASFTPLGGTPLVGSTLLTVSCNSITSIELLVVKMGSKVGLVTSVPTGINCGTVCGGLFNEGTGFALTAPGGVWSTGSCDQPLGDVCYFTLLPDSPGGTTKTVTVTFN